MHRTNVTRILFLLLSVALLLGCGDDDELNDNGSSSGNVDDSGEASDSDDGSADDGGLSPSVCDSDDATSSGVCVNEVDCEFIDTDGAAVTSPARDQAADCFFKDGCASDSDIESCISQCMQEQLNMTASCSDCYAASVKCTSVNCLAKCIDPSASQCVQCQDENGCIDSFFECSGLPVAE